jgi:hypothetical protein
MGVKYYSEMTDEQKKAHRVYIQALRDMGPERRAARMFELSEWTRRLFLGGLREANPHLSEEELHKLFLQRIDLCHNRNW